MVRPIPPLVVKIGGSLVGAAAPDGILSLLTRTNRPLVVVPGGGAAADRIRALQPRFALTDEAAHHLAILAMHETAWRLAAASPRLQPVESLKDIARTLTAGSIPVWLPYALQHDDKTIPEDWSTTSDALAARLAERLAHASAAAPVSVLLVKSCAVMPDASLAALTRDGIVDPVFGSVVQRASLPWAVVSAFDEERLAAQLALPAVQSGRKERVHV